MASPDSTPRLFISHSSRDFELAQKLAAALEAANLPCWIAPRDIPAGAEYNAAIMTGITSASAFLLLLTRHSVESDPVLREVERAKNHKIPLIPIRLEQVPLSTSLEVLISTSQWITAFPPPLDRHLDTLIAGIKGALQIAHDSPKPDPNAPPKYVGPYRILEQIGEGGMGTVYKAEQRTPVKRIVALKLIKPGFDTKEVIARFESERQALARMNHPHIAKVLEAGADNLGRPYFVMEYVPGIPITDFADNQKLSIKDRLLLFTQVCDAIAHAHSKAIIHRDIKATNVLAYLDNNKPTAKVIDFGIAKALTGDKLTDRTFNTDRGAVLGTYDAMSPEQADGSPDIDTRTDVYSLGVLLYELLTGAKPFDHATLAKAADHEARRIIREVDPPRPSTRLSNMGPTATAIATARQSNLHSLTTQFRSELEWIPLMAMRKEPTRRYASPLTLAEDIQSYLAGKPLLAAPDSAIYRAKKFLRRHRGSLSTAAAVLVILIAGITTTTIALIDEAQQKEEAIKQTHLATQASDNAEKATTRAKADEDAATQALAKEEDQRRIAESEKSEALKQTQLAEQATTRAVADEKATTQALADAQEQRHAAEQATTRATSEEQKATDASANADAKAKMAELEAKRATAAAEAAIHANYIAAVEATMANLQNRNMGAARRSFRSIPHEYRGWEYYYLNNALDDRTITLRTGAADKSRPLAIHPTLPLLATCSNNALSWIHLTDFSQNSYPKDSPRIHVMNWSPKGDWLLVEASSDNKDSIGLYSADAKAPAVKCGECTYGLGPCAPNWSWDGSKFFYESSRGVLAVDEVKNGQATTLMSLKVEASSVAWHPDNVHLILSIGGELTTIAIPTGKITPLAQLPEAHELVDLTAVYPKDSLLAASDNNGHISVVSLLTNKVIARWQADPSEITAMAWSQDGKLVTAGSDNVVRIWTATGNVAQEVIGAEGRITSLGFINAMGGALATIDETNQIKIWPIEDIVEPSFLDTDKTMAAHRIDSATTEISDQYRMAFMSASWSPDGNQFAAVTNHDLYVFQALPLRVTEMHHFPGAFPQNVCWAPDGHSLFVSGWSPQASGLLWVLDTTNLDSVREMPMPNESEYMVTFSVHPQEPLVAIGSLTRGVTVWNYRTSEKVYTVGGVSTANALSWSHDGQLLAIGGPANTDRDGQPRSLLLLDWKDKSIKDMVVTEKAVTALAWRSDDHELAIGTGDGSLILSDLRQQQEPRQAISRHSGEISSICYSPDAKRLATSSKDGTVNIWETESLDKMLTIPKRRGEVNCAAWDPMGNHLLYACDGALMIMDGTPTITPDALLGHATNIQDLNYSSDGKWLASGAMDRTVRLWDISKVGEKWKRYGNSDSVWVADWIPDGSGKIYTLAADNKFHAYDCDSGKILLESGVPGSFRGAVRQIRLSPNDQYMGVATNSEIGCLDYEDKNGQTEFRKPTDQLTFQLRWNSQSTYFATGSGDNTATIWKAVDGTPTVLRGHKGTVFDCHFNPRDNFLVTSSADGCAAIWGAAGGEPVRMVPLDGGTVFCSVFAPDGVCVASSLASGEVKIWNSQTGMIALTLRANCGQATRLDWRSDGKQLAVGYQDGTILLWPTDPSDPVYQRLIANAHIAPENYPQPLVPRFTPTTQPATQPSPP